MKLRISLAVTFTIFCTLSAGSMSFPAHASVEAEYTEEELREFLESARLDLADRRPGFSPIIEAIETSEESSQNEVSRNYEDHVVIRSPVGLAPNSPALQDQR